MLTFIIKKKSMCLRIKMNCDVLKNFIFQLKMKKFDINEFYVSMSKSKIFDDIILRCGGKGWVSERTDGE